MPGIGLNPFIIPENNYFAWYIRGISSGRVLNVNTHDVDYVF